MKKPMRRRYGARIFMPVAVLAVYAFSCDKQPDKASSSTEFPSWSFCAGTPPTAPLDHLEMTGMPDEFTKAAGDVMAQSLTEGELAYLAQLDWRKFTGADVFADPVVRKAVEALQPLVTMTCTSGHYAALTPASNSLSLERNAIFVSVAYADTVAMRLGSLALAILVKGTGLLVTGAFTVACGATFCTVAGIVAGLAIIFDNLPAANAAELPPVGAPADPALYCKLTSSCGVGGSGGAAGASGTGGNGGMGTGGSGSGAAGASGTGGNEGTGTGGSGSGAAGAGGTGGGGGSGGASGGITCNPNVANDCPAGLSCARDLTGGSWTCKTCTILLAGTYFDPTCQNNAPPCNNGDLCCPRGDGVSQCVTGIAGGTCCPDPVGGAFGFGCSSDYPNCSIATPPGSNSASHACCQ